MNGRGARAKKSFSYAGKVSGKWSAKALAVEFFSKTEQGKVFYIIPNYRHRWDLHVTKLAEWRATSGAGRAYNFDYVTCRGGKASGSVGKGVGENGFFEVGGGIFNQNAGGGVLGSYFIG